jgi:hypothetical protein
MSAADQPAGALPGARVVRADIAGTLVFVVALAVAIPLREQRFAQYLIGAISMALFAAGVVTTLWAYTRALDRSRTEEVGVANLFLLTGNTAPARIKAAMLTALAVQVVAALGGASVGAAGLNKGDLNALAFGVLVPMFGIGLNGVWAARHGTYGPRVTKAVSSRDRRID